MSYEQRWIVIVCVGHVISCVWLLYLGSLVCLIELYLLIKKKKKKNTKDCLLYTNDDADDRDSL